MFMCAFDVSQQCSVTIRIFCLVINWDMFIVMPIKVMCINLGMEYSALQKTHFLATYEAKWGLFKLKYSIKNVLLGSWSSGSK